MNTGSPPSISSEEMWTYTKVPAPSPQRKNGMYCLDYHPLPPAEVHRSPRHWNTRSLQVL